MSSSKPVITRSQIIAKTRLFQVEQIGLRFNNGNEVEYERLRSPGRGAVLVIPVLGDTTVFLIREYVAGMDRYEISFPKGIIDPGETPEFCAVREVEEETGYRIGKLEPLGWVWTTPGFTDEKIWLFLGRELTRGNQQLQTDELLEVVKLPLRDAIRQAADGTIRDGKSICALLRTAQGAFF